MGLTGRRGVHGSTGRDKTHEGGLWRSNRVVVERVVVVVMSMMMEMVDVAVGGRRRDDAGCSQGSR